MRRGGEPHTKGAVAQQQHCRAALYSLTHQCTPAAMQQTCRPRREDTVRGAEKFTRFHCKQAAHAAADLALICASRARHACGYQKRGVHLFSHQTRTDSVRLLPVRVPPTSPLSPCVPACVYRQCALCERIACVYSIPVPHHGIQLLLYGVTNIAHVADVAATASTAVRAYDSCI